MSHAESEETNLSNNPSFESILEKRFPRREILKGGFATAAAAASVFGGLSLAGCSDGNNGNDNGGGGTPPPAPLALGFTAVPKSLADLVTVPAGYTVSLLYALGDPIDAVTPNWADNGSETGVSYALRAGDHHDGIYYFGLSATGTPDRNANARGILAMNHEAPNPFNTATGVNNLYVHPNGATTAVVGGVATRTVPDECVKEINHHGVSVIEVARTGAAWTLTRTSAFNRRVNNSADRLVTGTPTGNAALTDAANPRVYNDPRTPTASAQRGNPNGHIIRWREAGNLAAATTFTWDIYLFGARATQTDSNINISGLVDENDFSTPTESGSAAPATQRKACCGFRPMTAHTPMSPTA